MSRPAIAPYIILCPGVSLDSAHCKSPDEEAALQGVFLKPRFTRGTHTFDFPILLTHDYTNWRMVLGAYLVPPVTILVVKRGIIRPLLRWHRLKQVAQ